MTHQTFDGRAEPPKLSVILAADETRPQLARQIINGISGVLVLLAAGLVVLLVVLWKAP